MKGGIQHRNAQTCRRCQQIFYWSPGHHLCPYCDLSQNARATGPYGDAEPCSIDCCGEESQVTNYNEAVAEARRLVKRSEEDQWRLAELTWEQTRVKGVTQRQWAQDVGIASHSYVGAMARTWERFGHLAAQRPTFAEAIRETHTPGKVADKVEHGSGYAAEARTAIRNMPPERKAEVARELLTQPEVAEKVIQDDTARTSVRRALDERYEDAPKPYPTRPAAAGSEPFELLSDFRKVHVLVDRIVQNILSGRAVVNDTERDALLKETEWLEAAAGTIKSGLSAGSLDQALRAFQEEWL